MYVVRAISKFVNIDVVAYHTYKEALHFCEGCNYILIDDNGYAWDLDIESREEQSK